MYEITGAKWQLSIRNRLHNNLKVRRCNNFNRIMLQSHSKVKQTPFLVAMRNLDTATYKIKCSGPQFQQSDWNNKRRPAGYKNLGITSNRSIYFSLLPM
jgi:hypothetical protein